MSAKKIPPLQTNETLNQTDTKSYKTHDNKHENKRIVGDGTNKGADPRNGAGDNFTNVTNDSGERTNSRSRRR